MSGRPPRAGLPLPSSLEARVDERAVVADHAGAAGRTAPPATSAALRGAADHLDVHREPERRRPVDRAEGREHPHRLLRLPRARHDPPAPAAGAARPRAARPGSPGSESLRVRRTRSGARRRRTRRRCVDGLGTQSGSARRHDTEPTPRRSAPRPSALPSRRARPPRANCRAPRRGHRRAGRGGGLRIDRPPRRPDSGAPQARVQRPARRPSGSGRRPPPNRRRPSRPAQRLAARAARRKRRRERGRLLEAGRARTVAVRPVARRDGGRRRAANAVRAGGVRHDRRREPASVCVARAAYTIQGLRHTSVPGKWACGSPARSRRASARAASRSTPGTRGSRPTRRSRSGSRSWARAAGSGPTRRPRSILKGAVKTTLLIDATTGRLLSGSAHGPERHDPLHVQLHHDLRADPAPVLASAPRPRAPRVAQEVPGLPDVPLFGPQVADRHADREPAAKPGMREEDRARGVHRVERRGVELVELLVGRWSSRPARRAAGSAGTPSRTARAPGAPSPGRRATQTPKRLGEFDVALDAPREPIEAEPAQLQPELERPEPAAQLRRVLVVVADRRCRDRAFAGTPARG